MAGCRQTEVFGHLETEEADWLSFPVTVCVMPATRFNSPCKIVRSGIDRRPIGPRLDAWSNLGNVRNDIDYPLTVMRVGCRQAEVFATWRTRRGWIVSRPLYL